VRDLDVAREKEPIRAAATSEEERLENEEKRGGKEERGRKVKGSRQEVTLMFG
jgi:hypothetical protein